MKGRAGGIVGVALLVALAACSHNPPPETAAAPEVAPVAQPDSAALARQEQARKDSAAAKARADSLAAAQAHQDSVRAEAMRAAAAAARNAADDSVMAERLHFDYNKSDLKAPDLTLLQQKLAIMQAQPQMTVQIAGNCDERGSVEYNMALGQRRAAAAMRWLTAHGISADRITIVSYGEERPLDPGHDEEAWAKNRRDDFVVTRSAQ
jgi:peptidoglycan-associated lipoprotein